MSARDDLQALLLETFVGEAAEQVQTMNAGVLAIEQPAEGFDRTTALSDLFREAHNLKGAARSVSAQGMEKLAHDLENLFTELREGSSPEIFESIYEMLDRLSAELSLLTIGESSAPAEQSKGATRATDRRQGPRKKTGSSKAKTPASKGRTVKVSEPVAGSTSARAEVSTAKSEGQEPSPPTKPELIDASVPAISPVSAPGEDSIRVSTEKLDALMSQVSELVSARAYAEQRLGHVRSVLSLARKLESQPADRPLLERELEQLTSDLESDTRRIGHVTSELRDSVYKTRMQPVSNVFQVFPRLARDLATSLRKPVQLQLIGGDVEVDRSVLDQLRAPLTHLLRNAIDHGIESPQQRKEAGKAEKGTVSIKAVQRGASLILSVSDDGGGIDPGELRKSAIAKGLINDSDARNLSDKESLWLIFRAGFSTTREVSEVSGRGVGMDVVQMHVERLHGLVDIDSTVGSGTTVTMQLPLSVASTQCLLVEASGRLFGVPISNVDRLMQLTDDDIKSVHGRKALYLEDRAIVLGDLSQLAQSRGALSPGARRPALILGSGEIRTGLFVDALVGTEELVIKPFPAPIKRVRYFSGAATTAAGAIVMIINVTELLSVISREEARSFEARSGDVTAAPSRKSGPRNRLLVVDDSLTVRTLEKNLLEAAGFVVEASADGLAAWQRLQEQEFDLVVSDIEMPKMDGIELLKRVRSNAAFVELPFILLSSRGSEEDQQAGLTAGADAYIVKGKDQENQLLEAVQRFI